MTSQPHTLKTWCSAKKGIAFYEKHRQKCRHLCQYSWIRWLLFRNIVTPSQSACSSNLDSYLVSVVEVLGGGKTDMTACWWKRRRRRPARVWGSGKWRCQARSLCHKWDFWHHQTPNTFMGNCLHNFLFQILNGLHFIYIFDVTLSNSPPTTLHSTASAW